MDFVTHSTTSANEMCMPLLVRDSGKGIGDAIDLKKAYPCTENYYEGQERTKFPAISNKDFNVTFRFKMREIHFRAISCFPGRVHQIQLLHFDFSLVK